jgi:CRP/FNR family transcriptional regulator, anaerobic regulatory protein
MYAIVNDHPPHQPAPQHPIRAHDIAEAPREIRLLRGQTLFFEGDEADTFFEIVSGTVRCSRLIADGRRQIHRFAAAGAMLGVGCIGTYGYTAEAVTDVVARRHRLAGLDAAMADANLRRRVLQALREELTASRIQMMLLGRMSAAERLATFLLTFHGNPDGAIELPMTRSDIADYLGLTIETVSRKLHELDALGVIRLETANRIHITDPGRIEAIAEAA